MKTEKTFDPHSKELQKALWEPKEYLSEYKLDILEKCGVSDKLLMYLRHPDKKSWKAVSHVMNVLGIYDKADDEDYLSILD